MLSSEFTLGIEDTLQVEFSLLKSLASFAEGDSTAPNGFALLLQDGAALTVLANLTADGYHAHALWGHDDPSSPIFLSTEERQFAQPSPGVSVSETAGDGLVLTLGSLGYGTEFGGGLCGCFIDVSSSYQPGAGTYQLLFGAFDLIGGGGIIEPGDEGHTLNSALALTKVHSVPEPGTLLLLSSAIAAFAFARRRPF